jgi:outer membrane immunogenic protein
VTGWTDLGVDMLAASCAAVAAAGGCVNGEPLHDTAWRGSVYGGFNWQLAAQVVAGVEADWGFANKTTTLGGMSYPVTGFLDFSSPRGDSFSVKASWDASVRGRLGVLAHPAVLLYATGGAAWLHVESTSSCINTGTFGFGACAAGLFAPAVISNAHSRLGWTAGGGLEAMLWSNWLVRGEYRYADLGTIGNTDTRSDPAGGLRIVSYDVRVRTHTMMLGLAYKLDWAAPVIAKF